MTSVTRNNQTFSIDITVYNQSNKLATGVITTIKLPYGLQYVSYAAPIGVFNASTLVWTLSELEANTAKTLTLKLKVTDISKAPFSIKQKVVANEKDINMSNNCKTLIVEYSDCFKSNCEPGTPSNPYVTINDYYFSTVQVNLSKINNVSCGCCVTKYELSDPNLPDPGNLVNFEIDYFSTSTGELRGHPIDYSLDWSFDYQISCLGCPDGQQFTYGPKTVTGSSILKGEYYTLFVQAAESPILLSDTSYYYGNRPSNTDDTISGNAKVYIHKEGIIRLVDINTYASIAGSNEDLSIYIRLNGTDSTLIDTISTSASERIFYNGSLNLSVSPGDYFEIIYTTPTFLTNPEEFSWSGTVYIQNI